VKATIAILIAILCADGIHAAGLRAGHVELLCHRTANEDVPENTLESLEQAALLGCDVVEVDVRKTLDGVLVLNHDGFLERLTDGVGEVEQQYYDDLRLRDAGGWMGERFVGLRIPLFKDALRLAREQNIRLILDLKDKGIGSEVLDELAREGMLERVQFGGEWDDVKRLLSSANQDVSVWVDPGITPAQVRSYHDAGKAVIVNFSANDHAMDLAAMKAAVAAGADGINVDYPRLGADAVGRPVERTLARLAAQADSGESLSRARAIRTLSKYRGFPLQAEFLHWLLDSDEYVSRAAAIALVNARGPSTPLTAFRVALQSNHPDVRANAAWALGVRGAPAEMLAPLLSDPELRVLQETLVALAHSTGEMHSPLLLRYISDPRPPIRGEAAIALAHCEPEVAAQAIRKQLGSEVHEMTALYYAWLKRGKTPLSKDEIDRIVLYYRCQMKEVLALSTLHGPMALQALEEQAFRPGKDYSQMNGVLAAFQLWDRIGADSTIAVKALASPDSAVADRAEWMLIQAGAPVLPAVRESLNDPNSNVRERVIRIVALQGDEQSLPALEAMRQKAPDQVSWAIEKIHDFHPQL
jgi:glycerophosphoryl diester phosphodiesterase